MQPQTFMIAWKLGWFFKLKSNSYGPTNSKFNFHDPSTNRIGYLWFIKFQIRSVRSIKFKKSNLLNPSNSNQTLTICEILNQTFMIHQIQIRFLLFFRFILHPLWFFFLLKEVLKLIFIQIEPFEVWGSPHL